MPHHDCVDDCAVIKFEVVLRQYAKAFARSQRDGSLRRFQFAADSFQQCTLSGSVGTNHTIDISIGELDVYVLVQNSFAKLNGKVAKCYHPLASYLL